MAAIGQRTIWIFWVAAALAAAGGLMPIVFGGTSSRLAGALVPFLLAAAGFGACGLLQSQGRTTLSIVYFVAGLAIVFGLLAMFSLPLRLAVLGTCLAAPAPCPSGLPRPLTGAENTSIATATVMGVLAIFVGFVGLYILFRRATAQPSLPPSERRIPAMPARTPHPAAAAATPSQAVDDEPELPAHEEEAVPELPPHEANTPAT